MPVERLAQRILLSPDLTSNAAWHRLAGFLPSAQADGLELAHPVAVLDEQQRIAWACVTIVSPGRTGLLIFAPLPSDPAVRPILLRAIDLAAERQRRSDLALMQALLPAEHDEEGQLLLDARFVRLAELIYTEAPLPGLAATGSVDWPAQDGDTVVTFDEPNLPLFARTIEATYVQTQDCPALEGLRRMDEIIAGHRGSGVFRPDLWFLFVRRGEPLAVILLNEISDFAGRAVELVYMGVVHTARGQGLGQRMLNFAMRAARRAGYRRMILAVDAANAPALRLYDNAGFVETMRRVAYILPLRHRG